MLRSNQKMCTGLCVKCVFLCVCKVNDRQKEMGAVRDMS